ncbi:MAG: DinB family protein [Pirellulales bacterium]
MPSASLLDDYLAGPVHLRRAVAGLSEAQVRQRPIANRWSVLEVVCHLADFEPIYADRIKRVLAEPAAQLISGDPDLFAARLAYHDRDLEEELRLIELTRSQVVRILRTASPADFARTGVHSADGPLSLETLLRRVTGHIPHHLVFLEAKRAALLSG